MMPMVAEHLAGWLVASSLICAALTWLALHYARARSLLDLPGRRRSHVVPTPRGGGIAIVITLLLALPCLAWDDARLPWLVGASLALVALIGWIDDHRPLSARLRLAVHLLAAGIFMAGLPAWQGDVVPDGFWLVFAGLGMFWLAGCINAWNFMDGSNGLVASQSLWLGTMLGLMLVMSDATASAWRLWALMLAAACAGFLPFNAPRARIFLGDVGSGALGLACGMLLLVAACSAPEHLGWWLLLPSALLVDAAMTLASRILRGRRWYTAHREHLYQWLVRSGWSHARVAACYMGWNLFVVVPACFVLWRWPESTQAVVAGVLLLATMLWWRGKHWLRSRPARQGVRQRMMKGKTSR